MYDDEQKKEKHCYEEAIIWMAIQLLLMVEVEAMSYSSIVLLLLLMEMAGVVEIQ